MIQENVLHYKLLEKIGEGGMGVVYKAEDDRLRRQVALKFLKADAFRSETARARFVHEAQATAALDHPRICTIYEIGEADDRAFIAMQYIEGQSLSDVIRPRPLPLSRGLDIAIQAAQGLQAAHDSGIVHRDVKSSNLMVTPTGEVKIMDFGLAKLTGRSRVTQTGTTVGTIDYMSPEQARGRNVDHRTDIWSLAVVLYELLTGEVPFPGSHDQAVFYAILNEDPIPITRCNPQLPEDLDHILATALCKEVEERYPRISDLLIDLQTLRRSLSAPARREADKRPLASIAVLPFANMSADPEQEYFCDGMAEEVINDLAHIDGLRVVSRTSSFAFKGRNEDIREIGRKLRVQTVLEGSVRKAGARVRITAQLINVVNGYHIWSQRYDRELEDIFDIQDEISSNIVQALRVELTPEQQQAIDKPNTTDIEAYDLYLRGRQLFYRWTRVSIHEAIELFSQAIARDDTYARAHAGKADCYSVLFTDFDRNRDDLERALESSQHALALDPDLAEAHAACGFAISLLRKQYDLAEKEFEAALRLDSKLFEAYYFFARVCRMQNKMEKAAQLFEQACLVRPDDYQARILLAGTYKALQFHAGAEAAYQLGLENAERHLEQNPDDSRAVYLGASALAELGEREKALEWGARAVKMDPENPLLLYNISCLFAQAKEPEGSLVYLEWAVDRGYGQREWAENDPDLEPVRDDPRFSAILGKVVVPATKETRVSA